MFRWWRHNRRVQGWVLRAAAAIVIGGVAICGCSAQPTSGRLTGGIRLEGGPYEPHTFAVDHQAGTVIVKRQGHTVRQVEVAAGHAFDLSLPPGSYTVTARVAIYACPNYARPVKAQRSVSLEVTCGSTFPIA